MADIFDTLETREAPLEITAPDTPETDVFSTITSREHTGDIFGAAREREPGVIKAFGAGIMGVEPLIPKTPKEFVTRAIPESVGRLAVGLPQFITDIGEVVYKGAKTITEPALQLVLKGPKEAARSLGREALSTAEKANLLAKGLEEFALAPLGIKPFPEVGEEFFSIENLKKTWGAQPVEALLGTGLVTGAVAKARGKRARAVPLREEAARAEAIEGAPPKAVGLRPPVDIGAKIAKLKKGEPLTKILDEVAIEEAARPPLTRAEEATRAKAIELEAEAIQRRGIPEPLAERGALEQIRQAAEAEARATRLKQVEELVARESKSAEEAAAVIDSIEGKFQEVDALVRSIKEERIPEAEVGERVGLQVVPPEPIVSPEASALEVARRLNEVNELRKTAEAATGMNLRSVYKPVVDEILRKLPEESRIIVEKEIAKEPIKVVTPIGAKRITPPPVLAPRKVAPRRKGVKKPPLKEALELEVPKEKAPLRPAEKRKAIELEVEKELKEPSYEELEAIEMKEMDPAIRAALEEADLFDTTIVDEIRRSKGERPSIELSGQDAMIFEFLKDRNPDTAEAVFEKLTKAGKRNIWNEINADLELYDSLSGRTKDSSIGSYLEDEGGFISFNDIIDKIKLVKEEFMDETLPRISRLSPKVANKAAAHASVNAYSEALTKHLTADAFPNFFRDKAKLSRIQDIMNKDQILHGYDTFLKKAEEAEAKGNTKEALDWYEAAKRIAEKHDLQAIDIEVRNSFNDPELVEAMKSKKHVVNPVMDRLYAEERMLDPNTDFGGRGKYYGVRTNLVTKELGERWQGFIEGTETVTPDSATSGNYRNPNVKLDPFTLPAKFTGEYTTNFEANLRAVLTRRLNEITKQRFYNQMIEDGVAIEAKPGVPAPKTIKGEEVTLFQWKRPETGKDGKTKQVEKALYIPRDIKREVVDVLNVEMKAPSSRVLRFINRVQLAQAVDAVFHIRNQIVQLSRAQGAGDVWTDVVRRVPLFRTADAVGRLVKVAYEVDRDSPTIRREIAEQAKWGGIRAEYPHHITPKFIRKFMKTAINKADIKAFNKLAELVGEYNAGKIIYKIDTAGRIISNRFYNHLVERGEVPDTIEGRRRLQKQMGEYNRRLMGPVMRTARDWGAAPFVVAGVNFNKQGIREVTGSPGIKAASLKGATKMRLVNWSGIVMTFTVPMLLNMVTTGDPNGRSGTNLGEWDLGLEKNEKGKHKTIDLAQLSGFARGGRVTGVGPVIHGLEQGHDWNTIVGEAWHGATRSIVHPWVGPGTRAVLEGGFNMELDEFKGRYAPLHIPEGGALQILEDFRAVGESTNPPLYSIARPLFREMGWDRSVPSEEDLGPIGTLLQSPSGAFGLKDRGSAAYYEMGRMFRNRGIKTEETVQKKVVRSLRNSFYEKSDNEIEDILVNALDNKIIDMKAVERLWETRNMSPLARGFDRLGVKAPMYEAVKVWNKATDEEKIELLPILEAKIDRAWQEIPEKEEEEFIEMIRPIYEDFEKITGR